MKVRGASKLEMQNGPQQAQCSFSLSSEACTP